MVTRKRGERYAGRRKGITRNAEMDEGEEEIARVEERERESKIRRTREKTQDGDEVQRTRV